MRKLKGNEYRCAKCKRIFEKGWSDEEAAAEFKADFPDVPLEETGLLCDMCYQKIVKWFREKGVFIR